MALSAQVQSAHLLKVLAFLPLTVKAGMHVQAGRVVSAFLAKHKREHLSAKTQSSSGPLVGTSGKGGFPGLVNMRRYEITGDTPSELKLKIFMRSGVAIVHQEGHTFSFNEPFLRAVPMKQAKNARGRPTATAIKLLKEFNRNRTKNDTALGAALLRASAKLFRGQVKGLFIYTSQSGRKFLVQRRGNKLLFWFSLQSKVVLKPRLMFYETWLEFLPQGMQLFRKGLPYAIKAAQARAGGGH